MPHLSPRRFSLREKLITMAMTSGGSQRSKWKLVQVCEGFIHADAAFVEADVLVIREDTDHEDFEALCTRNMRVVRLPTTFLDRFKSLEESSDRHPKLQEMTSLSLPER